MTIKQFNEYDGMTLLDSNHIALVKKIKNTLDRLLLPKVVILYGSFSKGEGTWDTDGITPYNDIDLIFIDKNIKNEDILEYKNILFKELKTKFIDISLFTKKDILKLNPSIFSFDLFENGLVINGDFDLSFLTFSKSQITTKDIDILFKTRIWTFVGSYPIEGFLNMNTNDQIFFNYQMSKAIFSIIDCLSILKQEYNSTYSSKVFWALEQDEFKDFLAYINFADQIKLKGLLNYKFSENKELFVNIGNRFSLIFELGLQKHYNNKLPLPDLVKFVYGNSFKTNIMKLLYFLKGINGFNLYNMIIAQYFIFECTAGLRDNSKDLKKIMYKFNHHKSNLDTFRIDIATKRIEN
jgi:hypothetical protein